jgi:hypothetical protein
MFFDLPKYWIFLQFLSEHHSIIRSSLRPKMGLWLAYAKNMKITICGSAAFVEEMQGVAAELKNLGHEVKGMPTKFVDGDGREWQTADYHKFKKSRPFDKPEFLNNHHQRIREHFDKVEWSDAILVTNYDKNGVADYIGPNTLMEMGVAFYLGKKIYLLNPVPDTPWKEEILGMRPEVLNGNLELLS